MPFLFPPAIPGHGWLAHLASNPWLPFVLLPDPSRQPIFAPHVTVSGYLLRTKATFLFLRYTTSAYDESGCQTSKQLFLPVGPSGPTPIPASGDDYIQYARASGLGGTRPHTKDVIAPSASLILVDLLTGVLSLTLPKLD